VRILHLATGYIPVLPDSGRSVENTIYQLAKGQAELGHDVAVVDVKSLESRGGTKACFCEVWSPPFSGANIVAYFMRVMAFTWQLPLSLYRNREAGIIHTHSQFPTAVAVILKWLFRLKAPIFYTAHSPYLTMPSSLVNRLKHTLIEGWVLRRVDRVVAQTDAMGEEISRRFNVEPSKIAQVYAGVDVDTIDKFAGSHPWNNSFKMVLYPAYINRRKNQMAVIKAIPQVFKVEPKCEFVFAGGIEDNAYFDEIKEFLGRRGILNAWFMGQIPRGKLYQLYRDATMVVFPSLFETQGVVILEAMAFGLPVIASDIRVVRDVVELKEGCALLVDPQDSREIAKVIVRVLSDKALRDRLSARGRELVYSRFSWGRIAQDTIAKYEEALNGRAEFLGVCADAHPSR